MTPKSIFPSLGLLVLFIILSSTFVTYAFASIDTNSSPIGGEGTGTISGYEVTDIGYHSDGNPSRIDSVTFTLNAAALSVKVKLIKAESKWYTCNNLNGNNWLCDTPGTSMEAVDQLTVVASNR